MSKVKYTLPFIIAIFATSLYSFSGEPTLALKEFGHYAFQKEIKPDYSINSQNIVLKSFDNISLEHLDATIIKLSSFPTRYYLTESGVQAMHWIKEHWQGLTQKRTDIRVQEFKHGYHNQPTIILTVEGYDPDLKNEIIILGGHGDSINTHSNDIHALAPGADDNAAGIAVLSELIRRLVEMDYKPQRTIQFIAYAAEEPQERSSYELTRWYREN
ncbi:MAG: M20/M25/M40 family metallo-hydrolase, partial [Pseudobdellovibrio sp.]